MIVLNVPAFGPWEETCREPTQAEMNPPAPNRESDQEGWEERAPLAPRMVPLVTAGVICEGAPQKLTKLVKWIQPAAPPLNPVCRALSSTLRRQIFSTGLINIQLLLQLPSGAANVLPDGLTAKWRRCIGGVKVDGLNRSANGLFFGIRDVWWRVLSGLWTQTGFKFAHFKWEYWNGVMRHWENQAALKSRCWNCQSRLDAAENPTEGMESCLLLIRQNWPVLPLNKVSSSFLVPCGLDALWGAPLQTNVLWFCSLLLWLKASVNKDLLTSSSRTPEV